MDLYEIRGRPLDVIAEEAPAGHEYEDFSRDSTAMDPLGGNGRATRDMSTFQRFSVNTNESLHFEPCGGSTPSPTQAEAGEDDVFEEEETEVGRRIHIRPIIPDGFYYLY